jgi:hypothetical protein
MAYATTHITSHKLNLKYDCSGSSGYASVPRILEV